MSTGVLRGHEGSPLVIGDMMYMHTPFPNNVYAVHLKDQSFKWKYEPKQENNVVPVMCCDTVNRGLAYGDGKILLQQADTTLVALDADTGKVVWTAKNGDSKIGETNTNAPHIFKDTVITGHLRRRVRRARPPHRLRAEDRQEAVDRLEHRGRTPSCWSILPRP